MASKVQKKKTTTTSTKSKKSTTRKIAKKSAVTKKNPTSKKSSPGKKTTSKKSPTPKKKPTSVKKMTPKTASSTVKQKGKASKPKKDEVTKKESKVTKSTAPKGRKATLRKILLAKRDAISQAIKQQLGQSLTDEQQRRLESAMDSGDQALVDLDREMGISLQEMRNKERQQIDDALVSLEEGTYGVCAECGEEISEKRLQALPFARLCVACQTNRELMEKIERAEQRS